MWLSVLLKSAQTRLEAPDFNDLIDELEHCRRKADESELQFLEAEKSYNKKVQDEEAKYIANGDMEGLASFRHMCAALEGLSLEEIKLKGLQLEELVLKKKAEVLEEELARLKAKTSDTGAAMD